MSRWIKWLCLLLLTCLLIVATPTFSPLLSAQPTRDIEANSAWQNGVNLYEAGDTEGAIALWLEALSLYEAAQNGEKQAQVLANLAQAKTTLGQYSEAIAYWQQFLTLVRAYQQPALELQALQQIGVLYQEISDSRNATQTHQQALQLSQQLGNLEAAALAWGNLGIAYKTTGNYSLAIAAYNEAIEIVQQLGDRVNEAKAIANLGNVYEALGKYEEAIEQYHQSLEIARSLGDVNAETLALDSLGAVYNNLGETDTAIEYHLQSLSLARQLQDSALLAQSLNNLGTAYHAQGKIEDAIAAYQESFAVARQTLHQQIESTALSNLAMVYETEADYERAIAYHQQSVTLAQTLNAPRELALALNNYAHTLYVAGKLTEAESQLKQAVSLLDDLRLGLSDTAQVSLFETQFFTYNLLQQVLIAQNKIESALEASERGRSRAFVSLLARKLSGTTPQAIPDPSIAEMRTIARDRNATLVEYAIVPEDTLHRGKLKATGAQLYIWVIQPTGEINFRFVDLTTLNLSLPELVRRSRSYIGAGGRGIVSIRQREETDSLNRLFQLHQLLIEPIAEFLPKNPDDAVIFIPQQELFLVPFAALRDAAGQYLIDKHTILTAPAIQILAQTRQQRQNLIPGNLDLIVGNPIMPTLSNGETLSSLPGAETEAIAIAQLLNTEALTQNRATEAEIRALMPQSRLIHLATHGLLDDFGQGVPGAIALAPSQQYDGLLTAGEILDLHLNAELVVLSACDTGQGEITGDGVIGLSRSFIAAGVPSLIVSLWQVPDQPTADLMVEFYRQKQQHRNTAIALRQAILATKATYPEPRDWAAFTLIGEAE
jgi:CHAT domain-containing protein/tetratricopeptide (TPR) repeat protein